MNYSEILTKARQDTLKHKSLWLFGLLSGGAILGTKAVSNMNFSSTNLGNTLQGQAPSSVFNGLAQSINHFPILAWVAFFLVVILLAFVLSFLSFFIARFGMTGTFAGVRLANRGTETAPVSVKEVFEQTKRYYGRVLLLHVLAFLAEGFASTLLTIIILSFVIGTLGAGLFLALPFLILLIPISWMVQTFLNNAVIAIIDEDLDVFKAIARSWQITSKHFMPLLGMTAILKAIFLVIGFVLVLPLLLTSLFTLVLILSKLGNLFSTIGIVIFVIIAIATLGTQIVFQTLLNVFTASAQYQSWRAVIAEDASTAQVECQAPAETLPQDVASSTVPDSRPE